MIRVMHLTSSRFFGGPERQMLGLADSLRTDVDTVFASFSEGDLSESFLREVRQQEFTGITLKNDTPKLLAARNEISDLIHAESIQVLICHGYKAGIVGWFAAQKAKVPAIAVSRGWTAESWKVRLYEKLDRLMLRHMNKVVCVSQSQADKVAAAGVRTDRIEVICNSISPERFASKDPSYRTKLQRYFPPSTQPHIQYIIGAAGRLSPEKGMDILIAAAKQLVEQRDDVGVVLFGDGALYDSLQEQILALGIEKRFILASFSDQLDYLMPHLDLFVQSSHSEGLPNVLLEAAAAGVPVIATAVGGTAEVVLDGETGLLVPPSNPAAIAAAVDRLLSDAELRASMQVVAHKYVVEKFTFTAQAAAYCELLEEVSKEAHRYRC